jgi:hypothetical protein
MMGNVVKQKQAIQTLPQNIHQYLLKTIGWEDAVCSHQLK